jgi:hypothetical protein
MRATHIPAARRAMFLPVGAAHFPSDPERVDLVLTILAGAPPVKILRISLYPIAPGLCRCAHRNRVAPVG